jgi:hypothetical protein
VQKLALVALALTAGLLGAAGYRDYKRHNTPGPGHYGYVSSKWGGWYDWMVDCPDLPKGFGGLSKCQLEFNEQVRQAEGHPYWPDSVTKSGRL